MKKRILLKLTGEVLQRQGNSFDGALMRALAFQIRQLEASHQCALVIGGGNLFRGSKHAETLGISRATSHQVGMVATLMNGLIVQDILKQVGMKTRLFSAIECPAVGKSISVQSIDDAFAEGRCLIFVGGTASPFFTTDTTAVVRALQVGAFQVWKATKVDGVYDADPVLNEQAKRYNTITYDEMLEKELLVVDRAALVLAQEHMMPMRVFNVFEKHALIRAAEDESFGSSIVSRR